MPELKKNNQTDSELEEMLKAGAHFGYSRSRRHPKMAQYIFGIRNNVEIFDLEKVKPQLDKALNFIKGLGREKKVILFVGTKPPCQAPIKETAQELGMPYVNERWIGGTITNFKVIRERVSRLEELERQKASGALEKYTKKEQFDFDKEISKLQRLFGGLRVLNNVPDALVVVDPKEEKTAIREAKRKAIPIVAILNTDCNPDDITYPIPGNDAAISSIRYFLDKVKEAYQLGSKQLVGEATKAKEVKNSNDKA